MLTVFAVTLGVAVVLAIDLAGTAATGSFRASMETLAGDNDLEIVASGGVPEAVVGTIATLPYSIRISPRIEDFAVIADTKQSLPLIGLDFVAESNSGRTAAIPEFSSSEAVPSSENEMQSLRNPDSVWVGASLGRKPESNGDPAINRQPRERSGERPWPRPNAATAKKSSPAAGTRSSRARFAPL